MRVRHRGLVVVLGLLIVGALAVPALAGGAPEPRMDKAPVGTWAGPSGDNPDDIGVLSIAAGPAGEQWGVYVEAMAGSCDQKAVVFFGPVWMDGNTVTLAADGYCDESGELAYPNFPLNWTFTEEGTMYVGEVFGEDIYFYKACPLKKRDLDKFGPNFTLFRGDREDNVLDGTEGNDIIDGKQGNDTLNGFGGIDILCGHKGNDTLNGGDGPDVILGLNGKDLIHGGDGWDFGVGAGSKDTLFGDDGNDLLIGGYKPDKITGGAGPGDMAMGDGGVDTCDAETMIGCENP